MQAGTAPHRGKACSSPQGRTRRVGYTTQKLPRPGWNGEGNEILVKSQRVNDMGKLVYSYMLLTHRPFENLL